MPLFGARVDEYELMFRPMENVDFVAAAKAGHLSKEEMVLGVRIATRQRTVSSQRDLAFVKHLDITIYRHQDVYMRTTLTLEDDVAAELREIARRSGRSFKEVVNDTLRRGLSTGAKPLAKNATFEVRPKACGFRAGIDIGKLNQLVDDLELEKFGDRVVSDSAGR